MNDADRSSSPGHFGHESPVYPLQSTATAEHYNWGNGCDGWILLRNNAFSVIEEAMPPSTEELSHYHNQTRQFFYVLSGELIINVAGSSHTLPAQCGLEVAPKSPHSVRNCGHDVARFLVISVPPSRDDRMDLEAPTRSSA